MTDQIKREELIEILDRKFQEHKEYDELIHTNIQKLLDKHETAIHGSNGVPGLKIRVDRIETVNKTLKRLLAGIATLWGLLISYLGIKSGT